MKMYFAEITHDIKVAVRPVFMENDSDIIRQKYIYVYFVSIENMGTESVRLLRRHWEITDSTGETSEVDGDGVIGLQPLIEPGKAHHYNSYCVLKSMSGSMKGYYIMEKESGEIVEIKIPEFLLRSHLLN